MPIFSASGPANTYRLAVIKHTHRYTATTGKMIKEQEGIRKSWTDWASTKKDHWNG